MIWKSLGFQAAAIAAIVAVIAFVAPLPGGHAPVQTPAAQTGLPMRPARSSASDRPSAPEPTQAPAGTPADSGVAAQPETAAAPIWSGGPEHDAQENAAHHWQKHGSEFRELHSERDYTDAAHDFVNHPPPGAEVKHDSRGDTLIYDPQSNTFAVQAPDGAPRTMFRPHRGHAYWDRQH